MTGEPCRHCATDHHRWAEIGVDRQGAGTLRRWCCACTCPCRAAHLTIAPSTSGHGQHRLADTA